MRQVALQEASVRVCMEVVNAVTDVTVDAAELPADGAAVGAAIGLAVALTTQDGAPVPWEAATAGLTMSVTPPGACLAAAEASSRLCSGLSCQRVEAGAKLSKFQLTHMTILPEERNST